MISNDLSDFQKDLAQVRASANVLISLGIQPTQLPVVSSLSSGLVVLLCGRFENFLKSVMRSFIEEINASYTPFSRLPINLRMTHFRHGAKVLQDSVPTARESGDSTGLFDLARRLASVSSEPFEAAWEAFTNTHSNPGPDTIKELMKNVGVTDLWDLIKTKTASHGDLRFALATFIEIRNECAHTGATASPLSPVDIVEYADKIEALSEALAATLLEHGAACVAA